VDLIVQRRQLRPQALMGLPPWLLDALMRNPRVAASFDSWRD
jgi:hypothetical protein